MKLKNSTFKTTLIIGILIAVLPACNNEGCIDPKATNYDPEAKKDDGTCVYDDSPWTDVIIDGISYHQLQGNIARDLTITASENWLLSGGIFVIEGKTLTIEPGSIIYAANDGTTPFLSIQQGAKIMACGTATEPIIFRPISDTPAPGSWGGIILNGYAPINTGTTAEGEGGTGTYGGSDVMDNSGSLCYVRVEYAGKILSTDNELNGFSFNGCGAGTELHHLQAYKGADDGFEFFGGTASLKYALSSGNGDDSFDWTHGWSGNGQFWIAEQGGAAGDCGIEADNNGDNNNSSPFSNPHISNVTLIGFDEGDGLNQGILFREGTKGNIMNAVITGFPLFGCHVQHDVTLGNMDAGMLKFSRSIIDGNNPFRFTTSGDLEAEGIATFANEGNGNETATDGSMVTFLNGFVGTQSTGAGDPTAWDDWFENASFIGAVETTNNWTEGWTLGL